mmetsp:Transcript_52386/g.128030  ORF Transcript_52386/g.128030 Transcript_52386/m.128030 type:complete len:205 (+) Transcript_52386:3131-3745(+)
MQNAHRVDVRRRLRSPNNHKRRNPLTHAPKPQGRVGSPPWRATSCRACVVGAPLSNLKKLSAAAIRVPSREAHDAVAVDDALLVDGLAQGGSLAQLGDVHIVPPAHRLRVGDLGPCTEVVEVCPEGRCAHALVVLVMAYVGDVGPLGDARAVTDIVTLQRVGCVPEGEVRVCRVGDKVRDLEGAGKRGGEERVRPSHDGFADDG